MKHALHAASQGERGIRNSPINGDATDSSVIVQARIASHASKMVVITAARYMRYPRYGVIGDFSASDRDSD